MVAVDQPVNEIHPDRAVDAEPLLVVKNMVKDFPGVRALNQVDIELRSGEVHVLFGENGAGKSTLINILAGTMRPDQGTILLEGRPIVLRSASEARRLGIATVFQEFSLAPDLTVAENILLGAEPTRGLLLDRRTLRSVATRLLDSLGFDLDAAAPVSTLSRGEQQMVEICKALSVRPRVLILDEPTASLTDRETNILFEVIARLRREQVGIIYITHRLGELRQIGDRVTVLRDGCRTATLAVSEADHTRLVELMTGRQAGEFFPTIDHRPGKPLLSVDGLTTTDGRVRDISLEVREGEIVGLAGLVGCGKSEIGRACFGICPIAGGSINHLGTAVASAGPQEMLAQGLSYVPADRRREGLLPGRSLRENISISFLDLLTLPIGILRRGKEQRTAGQLASRMSVMPLELEREITQYSGGNQQKSLIARQLGRRTKMFIFDEPTTGIDVGAKSQVYQFFGSLVREGAGILLISSDIAEIVNLCHRVYVIHGGSMCGHLVGDEITEQNVVSRYFKEVTTQHRPPHD